MGNADFRYHYDAIITEVYDGDTVFCEIDMGLNVWIKNASLRLYGIDTPELRGSEKVSGYAARDFLCEQLSGLEISELKKNKRRIVMPVNVNVLIKSHDDKTGKYGRLLATIWKDGVNINELMLSSGHAVVPSYS